MQSTKALELAKRLIVDTEGADATEYALLVGLIALGIVGAVTGLSGQLSTAFNNIGTSIANHTNVAP